MKKKRRRLPRVRRDLRRGGEVAAGWLGGDGTAAGRRVGVGGGVGLGLGFGWRRASVGWGARGGAI